MQNIEFIVHHLKITVSKKLSQDVKQLKQNLMLLIPTEKSNINSFNTNQLI